jgi:hypothetical protein
MASRFFSQRNRTFLGLTLLLSGAIEPRAQSPVAVTLLSSTSPTAAEPAVTIISVTGSNFPSGAIPAANVVVALTKVGGSSPTQTTATAVSTVAGTTRRVTFTVPSSISVASPTDYLIAISGITSAGVAFASSNSAALTVDPAASIAGVIPGTAQPGQNLSVIVTGSFTHFLQGATVANFGAGITINSLNVTDAAHAAVNITLAGNAAGGPRNLTMTTGVEVGTLANGFTIFAPPAILSLNPSTGQQGQTNLVLTITGQNTHFVQGTSSLNLGSDITINSVSVSNATSLVANITIPSTATVGTHTAVVTTGSEVASLVSAFNVLIATPAPCLAPPAGLVSWWAGDGNTSDLLGANNPSASSGVSFVLGEVGSGFTFVPNGYIDIPPSATLANQQFTLSVWVRPDGSGPTNDSYGSVIFEQNRDNLTTLALTWVAANRHFLLPRRGNLWVMGPVQSGCWRRKR